MWNSPRMRRRWPSGETRHCQIKIAPQKTHRTAFAAETRAKVLKHAIALHEHAPNPVGIFAIIRAVLLILINGIGFSISLGMVLIVTGSSRSLNVFITVP